MRVHKPKELSAKWARTWPASVQLPEDCCAGDLVEVLEALQVSLVAEHDLRKHFLQPCALSCLRLRRPCKMLKAPRVCRESRHTEKTSRCKSRSLDIYAKHPAHAANGNLYWGCV